MPRKSRRPPSKPTSAKKARRRSRFPVPDLVAPGVAAVSEERLRAEFGPVACAPRFPFGYSFSHLNLDPHFGDLVARGRGRSDPSPRTEGVSPIRPGVPVQLIAT